MRVKPKRQMIYKFGKSGHCYVNFSCNQIWDAVADEESASLTRDNISIVIPIKEFKVHFKEVKNEQKVKSL